MVTPDDQTLGHPLRSVSVHHLENDFLKSVCDVGLTRAARVYEVEPLVIRPKGAQLTSPRSGKKGASYVDSIRGTDHAGLATAMLSYTWGYSVGDIVEALVQHCESQGLAKQRCYVWICCLCVNQHRVQEDRAAGKDVPFESFRNTFGERVRQVGNVLALMAPWDHPKYVTRVWCVFELYTALTAPGCNLSILMPQAEAQNLCQALARGSYSKELWAALEDVRVEEAEASVEADRVNILRLVEEGQGHCRTNSAVRERLLAWFAEASLGACGEMLAKEAAARGVLSSYVRDGDKVCLRCVEVAALLRRVGLSNKAAELLKEGRRTVGVGLETAEGANLLRMLGLSEGDQGHYSEELLAYSEAEAVLRRLDKMESHDGAALLTCMAGSMETRGDLEAALETYKEAWGIRSATGSNRTLDAADLLGMMGSLECKLGSPGGIEKMERGLALRRDLGALATPSGAQGLQQLGNGKRQVGKHGGALTALREAEQILESVGAGRSSQMTSLQADIGLAQDLSGDVAGAIWTWQQALRRMKEMGMESTTMAADMHSHIAFAKAERGDKKGRLSGYQQAYRIREAAGSLQTPQGAQLLMNLGFAMGDCGDLDGELRFYDQARRWREETSTLRTLEGATLLLNIGGAHMERRQRSEAMEALTSAEAILKGLGLHESECMRNVQRFLRRARFLRPCSVPCSLL